MRHAARCTRCRSHPAKSVPQGFASTRLGALPALTPWRRPPARPLSLAGARQGQPESTESHTQHKTGSPAPSDSIFCLGPPQASIHQNPANPRPALPRFYQIVGRDRHGAAFCGIGSQVRPSILSCPGRAVHEPHHGTRLHRGSGLAPCCPPALPCLNLLHRTQCYN